MSTSFSVHPFAMRGRQKRDPGTLQALHENLPNLVIIISLWFESKFEKQDLQAGER